jgi:Putative Ig domain
MPPKIACREKVRDTQSRTFPVGPKWMGLSAVLVLISGCSSGESGSHDSFSREKNNHPPVIRSVSISPTPVVLSDPLTVRIEAQDSDLDTIQFRYRWLVNGNVVTGQTMETLSPDVLKRGDQVIVEVIPFDGIIEGAALRSASASVINTPPIISDVSIDVDHEAQGRRLLAKVNAVDPDNDPIVVRYRWQRNGTVVKEGEDNTLELVGLTPKDSLQVEVTASDGNAGGVSTVTERLALSNSAPTIVSSPSTSIVGDHYDYLVRATDADEDPITYELETSPSGMTIEAHTGRIQWQIAPEQKGSHRIKIVAKDSKGGFSTQQFELSVSALPKSS